MLCIFFFVFFFFCSFKDVRLLFTTRKPPDNEIANGAFNFGCGHEKTEKRDLEV